MEVNLQSPETITAYPENIKFKYSWRKYQQRVLDELEDHLTDDHLHIIAPPGSGKTVLGLEVAIRLNKPTLILAPTIAIRNQWIQRFCELFLQTNITPNWISRDIRNPKFMTVVTYQGIHAACNDEEIEEEEVDEETETNEIENSLNSNLENIIKGLKAQKIKTIVVDEAHHLKNAWWHTLTQVKNQLSPVIVGLTATPPYDVTANEFQRYIELNGPVDTEITVPELLIEGDLCPHQDYVLFTFPTKSENDVIFNFRKNIEKLFQEIQNDEILIKAVETHPVWQNPEAHLDWIYNNLSYYSSCLIFLNANKKEIPLTHRQIIGDKTLKIPVLDYEWMQTLLDFYLFKDPQQFAAYEEHQKKLENRLRRKGAIERKQLNLSHNKRITGFLTSSISKLNGIKEIVDFEYKQLGKDLRMVILSDFIRKEFYPNSKENNLELNKIGVIPIFEKLRRDNPNLKKIGVLTGSMIIIPKSAYSSFKSKAANYGITNIHAEEVPFDENYLFINKTEQIKHEIIHMITQIFQQGEIEILIGTRSLLGEGWDAPAINSLVLASFVGSFVLSNQMRGRAIRKQQNNFEKTANIWHLVCIDPTSSNGGDDFDLLKRRFRSFVGVSFEKNPSIENGTRRLNLPEDLHLQEEVNEKNREMFASAADRKSLKNRWNLALEKGVKMVEEIKIPFPEERTYKAAKELYLKKTIASLLAALTSCFLAFSMDSLIGIGRAARNIKSSEELLYIMVLIFAVGILGFGGLAFKSLRLYILYRDISKDIQQIGEALLSSLIKAGSIKTDPSKLLVVSHVDFTGAVFCHLEGGTTLDKSTFINALQEIIAPIDNPRYVIIRHGKETLFVKQKDYHSVPEVIGRNKKLATYFENQWEKSVGKCDLIFTRTMEGRKLLLKSRVKSLASQLSDEVVHVGKWR